MLLLPNILLPIRVCAVVILAILICTATMARRFLCRFRHRARIRILHRRRALRRGSGRGLLRLRQGLNRRAITDLRSVLHVLRLRNGCRRAHLHGRNAIARLRTLLRGRVRACAHLLRLTRLTRNRTIRIARCLCAALCRLHGNLTLFLLVLHEGESAAAQQQHDRNHDEDNQPAVAALVHHRVRRGCGGQRFERRCGRSGRRRRGGFLRRGSCGRSQRAGR